MRLLVTYIYRSGYAEPRIMTGIVELVNTGDYIQVEPAEPKSGLRPSKLHGDLLGGLEYYFGGEVIGITNLDQLDNLVESLRN